MPKAFAGQEVVVEQLPLLAVEVERADGTTARALEQLGKGDFAGLVKRAVRAAYDRARELS